MSPALAAAMVSAMAAARSGCTTTRARLSLPMPAAMSAMMSSGFSCRGLSDVSTATSAFSHTVRAMSGRLPASRLPPAPNTHHTEASRGAMSAMVSSTLARASGVCAKSTMAVTPSALRNCSKRPATGVRALSAVSTFSRGQPISREVPYTAARFEALNSPAKRVSTAVPPNSTSMPSMRSSTMRVLKSAVVRTEYVKCRAGQFCSITAPLRSSALTSANAWGVRPSKKLFLALRYASTVRW